MLQEISPIEATLWDMDGTLADTELLHFLAYQTWLARNQVSFTEEEYGAFLGATDLAFCRAAVTRYQLPVKPEQLLAEKEELLIALIKERAFLRPGVLQMLKAARQFNVKTAVASSATLGTIHLVLDTLNIREYFQAIASGEEVANSKPAPDVFLLAAQRLNVSPARCLVMEDSINGILAAKAAGMYCLAVPCDSTRYQDHSPADIRLSTHEQVTVTESGLLAGNCRIRLSG